MMCLKHLLLYVLLLPVPAVSPIFLLAFAGAVFWSVKPCGYCLTLASRSIINAMSITDPAAQLAILFCSTSPSSPFLSSSPATIPPLITSTTDTNTTVPLTTAAEHRSWISFSTGRFFDPPLLGYSAIAQLQNQTQSLPISRAGLVSTFKRVRGLLHEERAGKQEKNEKRKRKEMPPGWVDLRYKGVGFVLDLGWRRSEQGMAWEVEDWKQGLGVENPGESGVLDNVKVGLEKVGEVVVDLKSGLGEIVEHAEGMFAGAGEGFWDKVSFLGG
ncbi:hypothetical protein P7C73_g3480, partial [Tremellales sp. Uapishka_1]